MRISDWSSDVCSSDLRSHGILRPIAGEGDCARTYPSSCDSQAMRRPAFVRDRRSQKQYSRIATDTGVGRVWFRSGAYRAGSPNTGPLRLTGGIRSEEHTSELQSLMRISYAVFCLKKKKKQD